MEVPHLIVYEHSRIQILRFYNSFKNVGKDRNLRYFLLFSFATIYEDKTRYKVLFLIVWNFYALSLAPRAAAGWRVTPVTVRQGRRIIRLVSINMSDRGPGACGRNLHLGTGNITSLFGTGTVVASVSPLGVAMTMEQVLEIFTGVQNGVSFDMMSYTFFYRFAQDLIWHHNSLNPEIMI